MRRYWIPIAPFAQLIENPVRKVRVLGEDLVLYRDRGGRLGLIGDRCLHRRVELQFGIPDECGLRCPYHGWLFDETGACVERPLEAHPQQRPQQRLKGYPVRELGGLVFAYLGPLPAPDLPRWDLYVWPNALRQIAVNVLDCNWLQCQENTGDPTHSVWLHGHFFQHELGKSGLSGRAGESTHTSHARIKMGAGIKSVYAKPTEYGIVKGIEYSKELGAASDRVADSHMVIFPFCTRTGKNGAPRSEFQLRVPIDDTHTAHICYQVYAAPPGIEVPTQDVVPWYEPPRFDERGRPILDYVLAQDMLVWGAQGEIYDRSQEVLARTDIPLVLMRRQLEEQIAIVEAGGAPINVFAESPPMLLTALPEVAEEGAGAAREQSLRYRGMYHHGFGMDDADRYGPVFAQVQELHRRIEKSVAV